MILIRCTDKKGNLEIFWGGEFQNSHFDFFWGHDNEKLSTEKLMNSFGNPQKIHLADQAEDGGMKNPTAQRIIVCLFLTITWGGVQIEKILRGFESLVFK